MYPCENFNCKNRAIGFARVDEVYSALCKIHRDVLQDVFEQSRRDTNSTVQLKWVNEEEFAMVWIMRQ